MHQRVESHAVRKVRHRRVEEDATHQGGWLFADSFLALMVIFLATISKLRQGPQHCLREV
ncbi:MAG: hypothetical protein RL524_677 [Actinomycetota bacterium]